METSETEIPHKSVIRRINLGFTAQDMDNLDMLIMGTHELDRREWGYIDAIRDAISYRAVQMARRLAKVKIVTGEKNDRTGS